MVTIANSKLLHIVYFPNSDFIAFIEAVEKFSIAVYETDDQGVIFPILGSLAAKADQLKRQLLSDETILP